MGVQPQSTELPMASITAVVDSIIHVAIELSQSTWLVAARLPQANKPKVFRVPGGQAPALLALLSFLRGRLATRTRRPVKIFAVLRLAGMASGYTDF